MVEQRTHKPPVVGSIPTPASSTPERRYGIMFKDLVTIGKVLGTAEANYTLRGGELTELLQDIRVSYVYLRILLLAYSCVTEHRPNASARQVSSYLMITRTIADLTFDVIIEESRIK